MKALLLLSLTVCFVFAGCSNIRSKQLVGKQPVDLSKSIGDVSLMAVSGEWVDADGSVTSITVTNAQQGEILYLPPDKENDEAVKLTLRMSGDHVFANFEPNENGERAWVLIKAQAAMNEVLVWEPDTKCIRRLIAEGRVKGTNDPESTLDEHGMEVKSKNPGAVIDDPTGEWVEKMVAGEFGVIFKWRDPKVLRRTVTQGEATSGDTALPRSE